MATDAELVAALRTLGPQGRLPGQLLYATAALAAAGLDPSEVERWAAARGGGPIEAGAVKLRKGQTPREGRVGRPEGFVLVPESALG
jgi:hypothetical protein